MNLGSAPTRIRLRHRANQRADVSWHGRSAQTAPALPRPQQAEALSVPGDDGLRLDNYERRSPSGPEARERGPAPTGRLRAPPPPPLPSRGRRASTPTARPAGAASVAGGRAAAPPVGAARLGFSSWSVA